MEFKEKEQQLKRKLEKKRLAVAISRAQTAKEELYIKIDDMELNIERTKNHLRLQDDVIASTKLKLKEFEKSFEKNEET